MNIPIDCSFSFFHARLNLINFKRGIGGMFPLSMSEVLENRYSWGRAAAEWRPGWKKLKLSEQRRGHMANFFIFLIVLKLELVLGQFWESICKDSILLAIFAGEREGSIQKSKNRFWIGHDSFAKISKKTALKPKIWHFFWQKKLSNKCRWFE
jgi:hypothetical protein